MNLWKPDPDAFFYVMELYRCRAHEVIAIGDSHYDVKAAKAANIPAIFIIKNENRSLLEHVDDSDVVYFDDFVHLTEIFSSR
jgi:phosphoglycolate phosphatase-like HAD superfamily hydrolase